MRIARTKAISSWRRIGCDRVVPPTSPFTILLHQFSDAAPGAFPRADDERRGAKRNSLADKLTVEAKAPADLKAEKAAVEGERRTVEDDHGHGPVRYPATHLRAGSQSVFRWIILVVPLLLDPAAVVVLLAAPSA